MIESSEIFHSHTKQIQELLGFLFKNSYYRYLYPHSYWHLCLALTAKIPLQLIMNYVNALDLVLFLKTQEFPCSHYQARLLGRGEGGEFRQLLSLLYPSRRLCGRCLATQCLRAGGYVVFCNMERGESFPFTQQEWDVTIPATSQIFFYRLGEDLPFSQFSYLL